MPSAVRRMPALLTQARNGPRSAAAAATARWASGSRTSSAIAQAGSPSSRGLLGRLLGDVGGQHGVAAGGEPAGDLAPEPAACPGHDCDIHAQASLAPRQGAARRVESLSSRSDGRSRHGRPPAATEEASPQRRSAALRPPQARRAQSRRRAQASRLPAACRLSELEQPPLRRDRPRPGRHRRFFGLVFYFGWEGAPSARPRDALGSCSARSPT